ncbi:MAG: hypothetical protein ACR2QG_05000 [Gammaproteobacteria bacterium]
MQYDFGDRVKAFEEIPIFQRIPTVPVGDVYFRRPGPDYWEGKLLEASMKRLNMADDAYANEVPVKAYYDELGFRNPEDLTDWDIVVVGDSFTELGYLYYEDLFTTRLGEQLGLKVKNLGASFSAPLTYNFYLDEYGKSASTKHAMVVFFEGNDLRGLMAENENLQEYLRTGKRKHRNIRQSSFLIALYDLVTELQSRKNKTGEPVLIRNARFMQSNNPEDAIDVSVGCTTNGSEKLSELQINLLNDAVSGWAETARRHGLTPWFVYMPVKRRVLDSRLEFLDDANSKIVGCELSDFPSVVESLVHKHDVRFIDLTPGLIAETRQGRLTYNPVWDTHLNKHGSHVVSDLIAHEFKQAR